MTTQAKLEILGCRKVPKGVAVLCRLTHPNHKLAGELVIATDHPDHVANCEVTGYGAAGARAIKSTAREYLDAWAKLDLEGRCKQLWAEALERQERAHKAHAEAVLAAAADLEARREGGELDLVGWGNRNASYNLWKATQHEDACDDERRKLHEALGLLLGDYFLHRWEADEKAAAMAAEILKEAGHE